MLLKRSVHSSSNEINQAASEALFRPCFSGKFLARNQKVWSNFNKNSAFLAPTFRISKWRLANQTGYGFICTIISSCLYNKQLRPEPVCDTGNRRSRSKQVRLSVFFLLIRVLSLSSSFFFFFYQHHSSCAWTDCTRPWIKTITIIWFWLTKKKKHPIS